MISFVFDFFFNNLVFFHKYLIERIFQIKFWMNIRLKFFEPSSQSPIHPNSFAAPDDAPDMPDTCPRQAPDDVPDMPQLTPQTCLR